MTLAYRVSLDRREFQAGKENKDSQAAKAMLAIQDPLVHPTGLWRAPKERKALPETKVCQGTLVYRGCKELQDSTGAKEPKACRGLQVTMATLGRRENWDSQDCPVTSGALEHMD